MGCGSTNEINEPNEPKFQKELNTLKDPNIPEESPQIFRQEEMSFIDEDKEK